MIKNYLTLILLSCFLSSCVIFRPPPKRTSEIRVRIDLIRVKNDKVNVELKVPEFHSDTIIYHFAKIIPGTYAIADYGRFIEGLRAYDKSGGFLPLTRRDSNSVVIHKARELDKITYLVNDTYDTESGGDVFSSKKTEIFSPAGTNIVAGEQFMINWPGYVGYFDSFSEVPYQVTVVHPKELYGTTAEDDTDQADTSDLFNFSRYADMVDNPAMYSKPDTSRFYINDMEVILGVYSRNKNVNANKLRPALERMMKAQKSFLGDLNTTKKYAVICYLTTMKDGDAKGIGALEHNNSTVAVFRESMTSKDLISVISHEFFHTVTPLKIHSKEIQNFDFNSPEMSRHLWFYEGATEYFANLFQVNQGLISENRFLDLMAMKKEGAGEYNDSLSFTVMSRNVLDLQMKKEYPNVYQKGALIAMCVDILLRSESGGKTGLLDLERKLSAIYGPGKPFNDEDFIPEITKLAGKRIGDFLKDHVEGGRPLDYDEYLNMAGAQSVVVPMPEPIVFLSNETTYISIDDEKKAVVVDMQDQNNSFLNNLGLKDKDILVRMNDLPFNPDDGSEALLLGYDLEEGAPVKIDIIRDGKPMEIEGTVKLNYAEGNSYRFVNKDRQQLKDSWLRK